MARNVLRGAGRVEDGLAGDAAHLADVAVALAERLRVAHDAAQIILGDARQRQQAVSHLNTHLAHYVQPIPALPVLISPLLVHRRVEYNAG